ncbi:MAG: Chaperone protein DnaJ [Holosporales bacterium]
MLRKISTWFEKETDAPTHQRKIKQCDHVGCVNEGLYKAPKNANNISNHHNIAEWYWFCKDHVREYNANWNFYKNMTEEQAYRSYKNDRVWNRPSWPIDGPQTLPYQKTAYYDPFKVFYNHQESKPYLSPEENEALIALEISYPFTNDDLQIAYRKKVKQYHPDVNQSKENEERIRQINLAYQCLKKLPR